MLNDVINTLVKAWYVTMKEGLLKAHRGNPLEQLHYKKNANFPGMPTVNDSYYKFFYKKITCLRL